MVFQHKIIIPLTKGEPPNEKSVARFEKGLDTVLGQIENIWLRDNPYIAGKQLSIADLLAITELEQPGMAAFDVRKGRPKIEEYMARVRNDLQPHYDEAHSVVRDVTVKFKEVMQAKL